LTRREKLIRKIVRRPPEASFRDVQRLLEDFGWVHDRTEGSHAAFTKAGEYPIVVTIHDKRVKRGYLDDICRRLRLDEIDED
jgi:predicted RNA binding protein YcfA (HicA-like mRNA interferase family)